MSQALSNWPGKNLVASELAKQFNALGTYSSHKITPGLDIVPKSKAKRMKFEGTSVNACHTKQKQLVKIDPSLVDSGVLVLKGSATNDWDGAMQAKMPTL